MKDFIPSFIITAFNWLAIQSGFMKKPRNIEAEEQKEVEKLVEEEVDAVFNIGLKEDKPIVNPNRWNRPDFEDVDDVISFIDDCNDELDDDFSEEKRPTIQDLIKDGKKIHAIKDVREASGLGLNDSKRIVEIYSEYIEFSDIDAA